MKDLTILATSKTAYKTKASAKRAGKKALIQHPVDSTLDTSPAEAGGFIWVIMGAEIEAPKKEVKVEKLNVLRKSTMSGACALVWDIAEQGLANGLKRKDIIAQCVEAGVAFYTARTQYQKYTEALRGK